MTDLNISSNDLPCEVVCPTSKSYTNRALILGSLDRRVVRVLNPSDSEDSKYLVKGLQCLGVTIKNEAGSLDILGSVEDIKKVPQDPIYLGEGGSTIRFFMALAATMQDPIHIEVHPRFLKRPMEEFQRQLTEAGARIKAQNNVITIQGPMEKNRLFKVDCSKSTQFASALQLVSRKINAVVEPVNVKASEKYLRMTKHVQSSLERDAIFVIPPDFSSLSYFAAYACLTQKITVKNIWKIDPLQADAKILEVVKSLGGDWRLGPEGLTIFPAEKFNSLEIDGSSCLDLIPSLAFLLSYTGLEHKVRNIQNLRHKESDRLEEIKRTLQAFDVQFDHTENSDVLTIHGRKPDGKERRFQAAFDHRMVMMAALFLKINGGGGVSPAEAVRKSFPNFFNVFK